MLGAGNGHTEAVGKRERGRAMGRPALAAAPPAGGAEEEGGGAATAPLSAVVSNAVRRWFIDAHKEAIRGDVVRSSNPPPVLQAEWMPAVSTGLPDWLPKRALL